MRRRTCLKGPMKEGSGEVTSVRIRLREDRGKETREFTILKVISEEGGSCVCYKAQLDGSRNGVLKEFYPLGFALSRDAKTGQLVYNRRNGSAEKLEGFRKAKAGYVEKHGLIELAKADEGSETLGTFIPNFEVFYSEVDEKSEGTVYIWTATPELKTFETVCRETRDGAQKTRLALNAVTALTKRVRVLHSLGIVHRDIKPSNFGFQMFGDEVLDQNPSLFDINSLCWLDDAKELSVAVGSKGYMEPETGRAGYLASIKTDIYSIGATLLYALTGKTAKAVTEKRGIGQLVSARLFPQKAGYSDLRKKLIQILKKCLCPRDTRYESCEELLKDLEEAHRLFPVGRKEPNREKALPKKNAIRAIQYHLYRHPLYQDLPEEEKTIRVLVVGFNEYARTFLDACLQVGQMGDKGLEVLVVCNDRKSKETYLKERPALGQFFNVDGSLNGELKRNAISPEDVYGVITFRENKELKGDPAKNGEILRRATGTGGPGGKAPYYNYVFVSMGRDLYSRETAKVCAKSFPNVGYVWKGEDAPGEDGSGACPVCVNLAAEDAEIERMAFNVHLIWEKNRNMDYQAVQKKFLEPYNHDSCVGNVLSMKYKLHSMGIDLRDNFDEAARGFKEKAAENKNRLIWVEHRRWVTEKLCQGWQNKRIDSSCLKEDGRRDKKGKRHICIVRSRANQRLAGDPSYWRAGEEKLKELDGLDRVSVKLYQLYAKEAQRIKLEEPLLTSQTVAAISRKVEKDLADLAAFREWYSCMNDISKGEREKAALYTGLKDAFMDLKSVQEDIKLKGQAQTLHEQFYPILASVEQKNWKQNDVDMIDGIPFILTFVDESCLVIPYSTGNNSEVFRNVAAATVINPARLLYLYKVRDEGDVEALTDSFPQVMRYLERRRLRAVVELLPVYMSGSGEKDALKAKLDKWCRKGEADWGKRFRRAKEGELELEWLEQLPGKLEQRLKDGWNAVEINNTELSGGLQRRELMDHVPFYRFNSRTKEFFCREPESGEPGAWRTSCYDMLRYVKAGPYYINVTDMVAFNLSTGVSGKRPEFDDENAQGERDYDGLWKLYREKGSRTWKSLCHILRDYEENGNAVTIALEDPAAPNAVLTYDIPEEWGKGAKTLIEKLKEKGTVDAKSQVVPSFSRIKHRCTVTVRPIRGKKAVYDTLFRHGGLQSPASIAVEKIKNKETNRDEVVVRFSTQTVKKVRLHYQGKDRPGWNWAGEEEYRAKILTALNDMGYIKDLIVEETGERTCASFTYVDGAVKDLMTVEGRLLEVYLYHRLKATGKFDDVVSSYRVRWDDSERGIENEFDCIATRGFQSLFIECKAQMKIDQDYYFKEFSLAQRFGINPIIVMLSDVEEERHQWAKEFNAMNRRKGEIMKIITIYKKEEIDDIDNILLSVMDGTYRSDD